MRSRRNFWLAVAAFALLSAGLAVSALVVDEVEREPRPMRIPEGITPRVLLGSPGPHEPALFVPPVPARPDDEPPSNPVRSPAPAPLARAADDANLERPPLPHDLGKHVLVSAQDRKTKRPVNGALVTLVQGDRAALSGLTRYHGSIGLGPFLEDAGTVTGTLWHPRYDAVEPVRVDVAKNTRVELVLESHRLGAFGGTILDPDGNAPRQATLRIRQKESIAEISASDFDTWAATGAFRCDLAPGRYSVQATAAGFRPSAWSGPIDVTGKVPATADFVLLPEGRIEGFVDVPEFLKKESEPLELVVDCARSDDPKAPFETRVATLDARGRFSLGELASGTVFVRPYGAAEWTAAFVQAGSTARGVLMALTSPSTTARAPGSIVGAVRDPGGMPIPGARIRVAGNATISDAQGNFSVANATGGLCPLIVSRKGFQTAALACDLGRGALSVSVEVTLDPTDR